MSLTTMSLVESRSVPTRKNKFVFRVNESLLKLAVKLRDADIRINGRASNNQLPPRKVDPGVLSVIDNGTFSFSFHNGHQTDDSSPDGLLRGLAADVDLVTDVATGNVIGSKLDVDSRTPLFNDMSTDEPKQGIEMIKITNVVSLAKTGETEEITDKDNDVSMDDEEENEPAPARKTISLPNRPGPSLWPLLSNVRASADAEQAKFLHRSLAYYSGYNSAEMCERYVEPLSADEMEIIVANAVDAVLQKPRVWSREPPATSVQSVAPVSSDDGCFKVPLKPPPMTCKEMLLLQSKSNLDKNTKVSPSIGPFQHVSKRYAAAIANPRRFRCNLCPYSTNNRSHVRRHYISVHSDSRPFICYVCNKEFARSENAKTHIQTRHPGVPYDMERIKSAKFFKSNRTYSPPLEASISDTALLSPIPPVVAIKSEPKTISSTVSQPAPIPITVQPFPVSLWNNQFMVNQPFAGGITSLNPLVPSMVTVKTEPGVISGCIPCPRCHFPCRDAADLLQHLALNHGDANMMPNAPLSTTSPGFVLLQALQGVQAAATPVFVLPQFPQAPRPISVQTSPQVSFALPTANPATALTASMSKKLSSPILPQILPKVSTSPSDVSKNAVGVISFATKVPTVTTEVVQPKIALPRITSPRIVSFVSSSAVPVPPHQKRERVRRFKTFFCSRCPDRAPFRYQKSFDKHMAQHLAADNGKPLLQFSQATGESSESDCSDNDLAYKDDPNDVDFTA